MPKPMLAEAGRTGNRERIEMQAGGGVACIGLTGKDDGKERPQVAEMKRAPWIFRV